MLVLQSLQRDWLILVVVSFQPAMMTTTTMMTMMVKTKVDSLHQRNVAVPRVPPQPQSHPDVFWAEAVGWRVRPLSFVIVFDSDCRRVVEQLFEALLLPSVRR